MADVDFTRRLFLSGAAAAPVVAAASERIAEFIPPPQRIRITTANASSVVPPPRYSPEEVRQIEQQGKDVRLTIPADADELNKVLPEVDVIFGAINAEMFARAKKLRWLQATEAGVDRLLFPELVKSDVVVTNMQRVFAPIISESVIGMMMCLARGYISTYFPLFQKRTWKPNRDLVEMDSKTMGIVGMGGIGSATAFRAHYGFNMRILATDAKPMPKPVFVDTLREPEWFMEMVPQVDVLVSCVPSTPKTVRMFNQQVFRAMKKTAYFINVSRGTVVDQPALARALKEGEIAGAALDVTDPEPLPPDNELWDCPNLMITDHTSGFAPERRIRLMALLAENVRRYANGLPLMNVVDKERGY
ncbi:MAG: D-2-hydroxyacid dehydrogenase [bacterium]|jgi:phosphoglycerate dehydrogenase-like enzyme